MTEFHHPPIDTGPVRDTSLEEIFGERAYEILSQYAITCTSIQRDNEVTYPLTDRVDLISTDESIEVALRLVRCQVAALALDAPSGLESGSTVSDYTSSDDYIVVRLEYGTLEDEDTDEVTDEVFDWQPYVVAIIPNTGETSVVDAKTGVDLEPPDIFHAQVLMELMATELRGILCERALQGDDSIPIYRESMATRWEDLPTGEELNLNRTCNLCGRVNAPCGCWSRLAN